MKNTIYKFKIPENATVEEFSIHLPEDENSWDVVEVKCQDGTPYIWIDIEEEMFKGVCQEIPAGLPRG